MSNTMNGTKGKWKSNLSMLLAFPALVLFLICLSIAEVALSMLIFLDERRFRGTPRHRFLLEAMQERDMFTWI